MPRDLSPRLPEKISTWFPGRRCIADPATSVTRFFRIDVTLASITFTDGTITPKPKGVKDTVVIVHDTACALFGAGGTPTNNTALTDLSKIIATAIYDYRSISFDKVYSGINSIPPNGLIDLFEFTYTATEQKTRIQSQPWNGEPIEYQHQDGAVSSCTDLNNSGKPIDPVPCLYYYAPPEDCTGGGGKATATISGGAITAIAVTAGGSYTGTPTVAISGDGSGATATATASTTLTSIAVTAGGSGYTYAIVSLKGGGSSLQRTRMLLCLEDGRLVSRFISFDTVS